MIKAIILVVLPLAALVGTWIGFAFGSGVRSSTEVILLLFFAMLFILGFWGYFASERTKMNQARQYH